MADGSLLFDTSLDHSGFKKGLQGLEGVAKKGLSVVTGLATVAATAMIAIATASVNVGMKFEASMSQVAATMGITVDEIANGSESFEMLEKAAKDAGATTQFSASQSAEALNYLALAGYDAEKSVQALPTVLNLAAAGGLELAYASDLVTDSMSALGIESDELESFVDKLAKTSQKSNTSVAQLGEAILTVGGTAKIMAGGTTELSAQLGILADSGIKGSEGGTALRNVLLALSAPTQKQAEQMKELGISAYDANGNLKPTNEIFEELNGQLGNMTQEEKTNVLSNLFNKVDLKAANALLAGSGERFDELSEEIANADGAAAAMAETLNDNLQGKMTILGSSLEGLGIQIYEGMEAPLKGAVETAIDYVGQLSQAFEEDGFAGVMRAVGDIVAEVLVSIAEALPQFIEMGKDMILNFLAGISENRGPLMDSIVEIIASLLNAFFEIVPELFEVGILLLQSLLTGILEQLPSLIDGANEMREALLVTLIESIPMLIETGISIVLALIEGMADNLPLIMTLAIDLVVTLIKAIIDSLPMIIDTAVTVIDTLLKGLTDQLPEILQMGLDLLLSLIDGIVDNAENLIDAALEIINSLIDFILDNLDMIIDFTIKIIMAIVEGLIKNLDKLVDAALDLVDALITGITNNLPLIIDAGIRGTLALIDGLIKALPQLINAAITLVVKLAQGIIGEIPRLIGVGLSAVGQLIMGLIQAIPQLLTAAGTLVVEALKALTNGFKGALNIGKSIVEGIWSGISGAAGWLTNKIKGFADGVVKGIKGFFGIKSPSTRMKKEVGPEISAGIGEGFEDGMPELQRDIDKEMAALTAKMKNTVEAQTGDVAVRMTANTVSKVESDNQLIADSQILERLDKLINKDTTVNLDGRRISKETSGYDSNEQAKMLKRRR